MVSPGYRSFWGRPESRSRRATNGDDEDSLPHGRPVTIRNAGDTDDDKDHSKKNGGGKMKNGSHSTSILTASTTPPLHEEPAPQEPTDTQTSPVLAAATSPTLLTYVTTSTSLAPDTLATANTVAIATTVWLTTSEVSTITNVETTTAVSALAVTTPSFLPPALPPNLFKGESDDDCCHGKHHGQPPNNNKFAIAFGIVGGLGFLVGFLWLAFLVHRSRKRRYQGTLDQYDYGSSVRKASRFNTNWLPGHSRYGSEGDRRQMGRTTGALRRADTSVMDQAMQGAYGRDGSSLHSVPRGYRDEKRQDPKYPLPVLDPTPIQQASLRKSIASWFRRSTSHHPLGLNPNSRWSQSTAIASTTDGLSRTTTVQSDISNSLSIYSHAARLAPPPMPELDVHHTYMAATLAVELPAHPVSAYPSRDPAPPPAPYVSPITTSRWSRSTSGHERMSSLSSRTDATQTTFSGGRESIPAMPQASGLSPPGFHRTVGSGDSAAMRDKDVAELTNLRDELLELYTQGARPASAVGMK